MKEVFSKAIFNSNSGTMILIGTIDESGENIVFDLTERIKEMESMDKLQELFNRWTTGGVEWIKYTNFKFTDSLDHSILQGGIEATFFESSFLFVWNNNKSTTRKPRLVTLTVCRPPFSDVIINDILTIIE